MREQSKPCGASELVGGASERANGRASGPVLQSGFLVDLAHCVVLAQEIVGQNFRSLDERERTIRFFSAWKLLRLGSLIQF